MKKLIKMIIKKIYNILNLISYLYIKKKLRYFSQFLQQTKPLPTKNNKF